MNNYTLVLVCGHTTVARSYKTITTELVHETAGCTVAASHTLVIHEKSVIFEHCRGEVSWHEDAEGYAELRKIFKEKKEIRVLSEREIFAIEKACCYAG